MNSGHFESWDGMNKLIDFLIRYRLPPEQTIFLTKEEQDRVDEFLCNLGSSGVTSAAIPNTDVGCSRVSYRGFTFNLVNIDGAKLFLEETTIPKGSMIKFWYQTNKESTEKTFFINECGKNEFIGYEVGSQNKINFQIFKPVIKK